ncbi:MAG: PAS domain S-box protein [Anaerolineae bacterium]|nr:PAS domain S-box protein [Anaerolineae bacterium]
MDILEHCQLAKRFTSFSKYCSLIVMGIGIFALTGWIFNIPAFKTVLPGLPTMKVNTALAFLLAGIALWIANRDNAKAVTLRIMQICSGVALLTGLLTLGEYIFRLDLGIDQLIFKDLQTPLEAFPGRMAFASALCLNLIGTSFIFIHTGNGKVIDLGQYLAVIVLAISLLALVGYVYDVQALYRLDQYTSMSLHTAAGFALLALGTLSAQPDRGWMRLISMETAGGTVLRRLLPFILGVPIFIGGLVVLGNRVGLYEIYFGFAMLSVITAGILTITLWLISRQLNHIDAERKQAEEMLLQSEQKFSILFEKAAFAASLSKLPDGVMVDVNEAFEKSFEYTKREAIGRTSLELGINPDAEDRARILAALREDGSVRNQEMALHTKSGKVGIFSVNVDLIDIGDQKYILNTTQDITERKQAQEELQKLNNQLEQHIAERTAELSSSEARFRGLFEHAPVSIWEEDFSAVRQYIDDLRNAGIMNLSAYFDDHPEEVSACAALVKIVDVNHATIEMYQAESKAQLLTNLSQVFGPESLSMFKLELLALAGGETSYENETVNYILNGESRIVFVRLTVAPGHEQTWAKVFVGISNITEQRQVEAALAAERDLLQALMDNIPDTIYFKDTASRFTRINRAQAGVLRVAALEDAIGKTDLDFQNTQLARSFYKEEQLIIQTGEPLIDRIEFNPNPDGKPRWFSATKVPIRDDNGQVTGIVGVSRNITELKQAEEAMRESEAKLRAIFNTMSEGIALNEIIYDEKGEMVDYRILEVNQAFYSTADYSGSQVIGNLATKLYGMSPEVIKAFWETHKIRSEVQHTEYNSPLSNRSFFISTSPFVNDRFVTSFFDITELKQAEAALRQSEEKFRSLVERLPAITYISAFDEAKTRLYVSPQNETYLGFTPNEWLADPDLWRNQLHPDDRERVLAEASRFYETGEPFISEYRTLSRDGKTVWFHDEAVIIRDASGLPQYIQGVKVNMTERKEAEEALRQSEERFRLVAWATKDAVWDWDLKTDQILWGAALQKVFHYSSEITQTDSEWWRAHIHPQDREKVGHSMDQALEGGMEFWSREYRFQRFDGTYADIMDRGYILHDKDGRPYRMIGAMMDITERRQAEATIIHQNEMLSSLHQITLDLLRYREINPLLDALVGLAAKFMDAPYAEIMLVEDETLVVRAAIQNQHHLIGERVGRRDALLSWQAFDTREPAVLSDYAKWPHRRAVYDEFQLHAVADFPILNDDQCLGVLALGRDQPDYEFNLDQIQYGRLFANLTALVLNNAQLREALREQSIRDPLTGTYNRRYMEEALKQQLSRVTRQLHPLGIIMIDIDHFKRFNDTHGHAAGDALLRELGRFLQNHIRGEDIACRYGGEEFILIMPDASLEATQQRAEHLRQEVKGLRVRDASQLLEGITLSLGVAIYPQHGRNMEIVMRAADAALYRAKQEGRDRVVVAEKAD